MPGSGNFQISKRRVKLENFWLLFVCAGGNLSLRLGKVKIGNTTISGSKFNTKDAYNFKFSKFSGKKTAFSLKLKSGWYLNGVTEKISNSNNLNYLDPDIKTFKVRSKKGSYSLILNFYNEKQHSNENVVLNFK